jgi:transposase
MVELYQKGQIDLRFGDESGFSLTPNVPYGWLPVGEQAVIPSERSKRLNVFGLMNPDNALKTWRTFDSINADFVVQCINEFAEDCLQRNMQTVIVWDNASWHTAKIILEQVPIWEEKGLFLFSLPTYSPHLNKIETLWRFMKNDWLESDDYKNLKSLENAVVHILKNFGSEYKINFSLDY